MKVEKLDAFLPEWLHRNGCYALNQLEIWGKRKFVRLLIYATKP